ncbi:MAG: heavy metal translocating P-type ATPase [Polyangiaceae bacterium]|jgi:P-type Cu2+ transporter
MQVASSRPLRADVACLHCGNPAVAGAGGPFCCAGCRAVYGLLQSQHLGRYYDLRGARGVPVPDARAERRDTKWLDAIEARRQSNGGSERVDLDIQGLRCSACVWLIETIFRRREGAVQITVNPSLGRAQILAHRAFDLRAFIHDVESFGYLFGPPLKTPEARGNGLVVRMGICIALAMNAMIFAIATYAGLHDGPTYALFQRWNLGLSFASVLIGGSVFFRSAWQGLRCRVLHLDLPIALGIALAFGGSLYGYATHREGGVFIDTLDVFIALMLVGRFLQERVLENNRLALLANDGALGLLARRERDGRVETVRCTELRAGDRLVIAPGDLVPVDGTVAAADGARFSLDWINGESRARTYAVRELVPAGAFLAGSRATTIEAREDFDRSPLLDLLRTPLARKADGAMSAPWWNNLAKWYVLGVLAAATVGFVGWILATHDFARSVEVTTAVLIVTCPCAFGIATPLAYDLAQAGLRRAGLFVRSAGFLDRAPHVRTVVFDKTGTLTNGTLRVRDRASLGALDARARSVLASMTAASTHPKSLAVHRALDELGAVAEPAPATTETPGQGLSLVVGDIDYRLGAPGWAATGTAASGDVVFSANDHILADLSTEESLRPDAEEEVRALRRSGYDVWLLSGDDSARVAQTARAAGIREDHAIGDASPQAKAAWVAGHDRGDLLMIGDGINDSLVVERAFCSGTPAIDRPFMAARSDFYFVTPGLGCIRLALRVASALAGVRRRNLTIAVAYNLLAISLAYAGVMSPLACAVLMPASSLTTILAATFSLAPGRLLWRS